MNSEKPFVSFLNRNRTPLLLGFGLIFILALSFAALTTKPKLWTDEAVSMELARNFQIHQILDIETAPGVFSGFSERLQSTGYPVTIALAAFFELFGFGFVQARLFMLLIMLGALAAVFLLARKLFGLKNALASFFLVISFASFYAGGRTVVGEIPGFVFLLSGLYLLIPRGRFFWAGFWMGLAVVAKPSVFLLVVPALVLTYIIEWRKFFRALAPAALGMLPAALVWIFLVMEEPFMKSSWLALIQFYRNPFGGSVAENVFHNLASAPRSTTLVYFGLLFLAVLAARVFLSGRSHESSLSLSPTYPSEGVRSPHQADGFQGFRMSDPVPSEGYVGERRAGVIVKTARTQKTIYNFIIIYSLLAFVYYLRSPGWLRYILIAELLILFLLPHALGILWEAFKLRFSKFKTLSDKAVFGAVSFLVVVQAVQMFTVAEIFSSSAAIKAAEMLNRDFAGKSVAVLNALEVGVLLDTPERYLSMELAGLPRIGQNPLLAGPLPELAVGRSNEKLVLEAQAVLKEKYKLAREVGGYDIYELSRF